MPLIDMPIEKLKMYRGTNPKPADFDTYWERGLKEVAAINPEIIIKKTQVKSHTADICELYFTSVGRAKIFAQYLSPKMIKKKMPVILLFHGYAGFQSDYFNKLAYVNEGYIVLAMDCRGQDGKSEDNGQVKGNTVRGHIIRGLDDSNPDKLYFRNVFLDTVQLINVAKSLPNADSDKIFVRGASQGGGLTVACAALGGKDIKKIVPEMPFLSDYKRVYEMDMMKGAYEELNLYIRNHAPVQGTQDYIWEKLGYIDIHNLAPRISAEVYWGIGLMDSTCPPSTQFATYNAIKSKKEMVIYTNHAHEAFPGFSDRALNFFNEN